MSALTRDGKNSEKQWIHFPDWESVLHPDLKRPRVNKDVGMLPWIKTPTNLLYSDEWLTLTHHRRGVLLGLMLAYAASGGKLRADTATLTRRLDHGVSTADLAALEQAGFLRLVQAERLQRACLEKRREDKDKRRERGRAESEEQTAKYEPAPNFVPAGHNNNGDAPRFTPAGHRDSDFGIDFSASSEQVDDDIPF